MLFRNIIVIAMLFMITLMVVPSVGFAETHQRDTWYIGFGLGGGAGASYKLNGKDITFDDWLRGLDKSPKVSFNFKVGATISPKTLLGFDATAISQEGTIGSTTSHIQINNYFLMLTHFPFDEGLFLRGGGGFSNILYDNKGGANNGSDVTKGYGVLGGIGYAFWLGKSFNFTLNADHSRQFYPTSTVRPESSQFTSIYLGFDWY